MISKEQQYDRIESLYNEARKNIKTTKRKASRAKFRTKILLNAEIIKALRKRYPELAQKPIPEELELCFDLQQNIPEENKEAETLAFPASDKEKYEKYKCVLDD